VQGDRDRDDALDAVAGESWDAVVDVARQPGQVRRSTRALAGVPHYVFVSTISVYADESTPGQDESGPLLAPLESDVMASMEEYGAAKVACERAVVEAFGDRATVARAGLIGGPGDWSDRSAYWPSRFAHPSGPTGDVLAPDARDQGTAVIDARDIAAWLVRCATDRIGGTFNASGPVVPLGEHLATAQSVARHAGDVVWTDPAWLREHEVGEWMGPRTLPLWLPEDELAMTTMSAERAFDRGLAPRPLESTLADTLAWRDQDRERPYAAGLSDADERELLAALRG
jgi:2'-hydroxyisoflavone reductase